MALSRLCKRRRLAQQNHSSCYQDDSSYEDKDEDEEEEEHEQEQQEEQQEQERPQGRGRTLTDEFRQSILQQLCCTLTMVGCTVVLSTPLLEAVVFTGTPFLPFGVGPLNLYETVQGTLTLAPEDTSVDTRRLIAL